MWPFKRRKSEEARFREAFSQYLSEDVIDTVLARGPKDGAPPRPWTCAYALLQVRDEDLNAVSEHLSRATEILLRRDGVVSDFLSSLVLATFGLPLIDDDLDKARSQQAKAVARLLSELGSNVRLIHGVATGLAGNIGAQQRFHFGVLLPDLDSKLATLLALDFGRAAEVEDG